MSDEEILSRINVVLDDIRPSIQMDGGDILFDSFENGIITVRLKGSYASDIMEDVVKDNLRNRFSEDIPEIDRIATLVE